MKTKLLLTSVSLIFSLQIFSQSPDWSWTKAMGGTNNNHGLSIAIDNFDNVYTTGYFLGTVDFDPGPGIYNLTTVGSSIAPDIFIFKLDDSGSFVWAKAIGGTTHGGGKGYSIALDTAGNIYTTGYYGGPVDFDPGEGIFNLDGNGIFILKLDDTGNFVWVKRIGGETFDEGNSLALDASGNVYTTGRFHGTSDFDPGTGTFNLTSASSTSLDIFISKLDVSGNFVWAKAIGGNNLDYGNSIAIDAFDNVYTTGSFDGTVDFDPGDGIFNLIDGSGDTFISKLDGFGNFVWAKAMGGYEGYSIALDHGGSGDVYITDGGGISKLDSAGNLIWTKTVGAYDYIALDPAGNGDIYVTGNFYDTTDFDPGTGTFNLTSNGNADIFISKLDISGNFLWAKAAGGAGDDYSSSIAIGASGNVYTTGYFDSASISFGSDTLINADKTGNTDDMFVARLNSKVTGIESMEDKIEISVYPNPMTNQLEVCSKQYAMNTIGIYNVLGEIILHYTFHGENQSVLDVGALPAGIYIVVVRDEKNNLLVKKIIKM